MEANKLIRRRLFRSGAARCNISPVTLRSCIAKETLVGEESMAAINSRSVWKGALVGGIVFFIWSMLVEFGLAAVFVGKARMDIAMNAGWFLKEPRVPVWLFLVVWLASLFVISYGLAWAYAAMRATAGAGPMTALTLGAIVGFAAGFPMEFAHAVFQPLTGRYGVLWMIEMGVGCILAALVAGWVYKDAPAQG
jgi:heme/copper-type cytochrome/quinol oxidase subunit 3